MTKQSGMLTKKRRVTFTYTDPQAREVSLVGDFNEWRQDRHPMKMKKGGRWTKVVYLLPGAYEYKFFVDGVWKSDAHNTSKTRNCFGTRNSLMTVKPA